MENLVPNPPLYSSASLHPAHAQPPKQQSQSPPYSRITGLVEASNSTEMTLPQDKQERELRKLKSSSLYSDYYKFYKLIGQGAFG